MKTEFDRLQTDLAWSHHIFLLYNSSAWSTNLLSTCWLPMRRGDNWHIDFSVMPFYHGLEACTYGFVLQAVLKLWTVVFQYLFPPVHMWHYIWHHKIRWKVVSLWTARFDSSPSSFNKTFSHIESKRDVTTYFLGVGGSSKKLYVDVPAGLQNFDFRYTFFVPIYHRSIPISYWKTPQICSNLVLFP